MSEKQTQTDSRHASLSNMIEAMLTPLLHDIPETRASYEAPLPGGSEPIMLPDLCISVEDLARKKQIFLLIKGSMGECLLLEARTLSAPNQPIAVGVFSPPGRPDCIKLACALCSKKTLPNVLEGFVKTLIDPRYSLNSEAPLGVAIFK
jgi:hypothetical protein